MSGVIAAENMALIEEVSPIWLLRENAKKFFVFRFFLKRAIRDHCLNGYMR